MQRSPKDKQTMVDLQGNVFTLSPELGGSVKTFTPASGPTYVWYKDDKGKFRRTR
jgi:hypothetical protein